MRTSMSSNEGRVFDAICDYDSRYNFVHGDERHYTMFGDNATASLDKLVYEEDWDTVKDFLSREVYDEPCMARMLIDEGCYRYMLIYRVNGARSEYRARGSVRFFLTIKDVVLVSNKFIPYFNNLRKYRKFLSSINVKYFDYDVDNDIVSMYYYRGGHSHVIYKEPLSWWQPMVLEKKMVLMDDVGDFNKLCDMFRTCDREFDITIHTSMFSSDGKTMEPVCFKGSPFSDSLTVKMTSGIIFQPDNALVEVGNAEGEILDSYTGLLNKKTCTEAVIKEIDAARNEGKTGNMYLCVIDIDDFKTVNDTYGHKFGDEVIMALANALRETYENNGILGRIGGDEFMCLLYDFTSVVDFKASLTDMRKDLKKDFEKRMPGYVFSVSIGIAVYPDYGMTYEELFKIADASLYIAKEKGKDRYIIYDKALHEQYINESTERGPGRMMADFMKPIEKSRMAAEMIIRVVNGGRDVVRDVLDDLMDSMNLHGVILSMADEPQDMVIGHYSKPMTKIGIWGVKKYLASFDENGINRINNVNALSYDFKDVYEGMRDYDICSTLQIKLMHGRKCVGIVCFDTFGAHRRKWSQEDISAVYMVCKAIEKVM